MSFGCVHSRGVICLKLSLNETTAEAGHLRENIIGNHGLACRVYNFAKSWLSEFCYFVTTCFVITKESLSGSPSEYVVPSGGNNNWMVGNAGLYIAIHGLNGHPNIWRNQLIALRKLQPDFEIRLPYVPQRGNCSLDNAVNPIEDMIRDYVNQYPGQPVCLMGVSNGARIALELEVRLRDTTAPILVSSVAGALSGTKQMNLMHMLGLANMIFKSVVVNDMLYQGKSAKSLLNRVRATLPNRVDRVYDFYASPDDFQIKPYTGSFPILKNKVVKYFVVPAENHNSIVAKISSFQIKRCISWMQTHTKSTI